MRKIARRRSIGRLFFMNLGGSWDAGYREIEGRGDTFMAYWSHVKEIARTFKHLAQMSDTKHVELIWLLPPSARDRY